MAITVATSNVNGIRAAYRKNMEAWVSEHKPDVLCMQEVRAPQKDTDAILASFARHYTGGRLRAAGSVGCLNEVCKIPGRAGVALISDLVITDKRYGLAGLSEDVDTGRWIEADITTPSGYGFTVVDVYMHAGNVDDPAKMKQKFRFLDHMMERAQELEKVAENGGRQAVMCGDFNIAHTPADIKNAKANEKNSGFLPEERAYLDRLLGDTGFTDVMRSLAGDIQGPYTWWSQRGRAFDNNTGWRLDYQFATPGLARRARSFTIDRADSYDTRWSDHAPLTVAYDI